MPFILYVMMPEALKFFTNEINLILQFPWFKGIKVNAAQNRSIINFETKEKLDCVIKALLGNLFVSFT
jgi:hypothetical protein